MRKAIPIVLLVLVGAIGASAYTFAVYLPSTGVGSPSTGTLNIYFTDPPPSSHTLKYLLVNVTSITLKYSASVIETSTTSTNSSSTSTNSTSVSSSSSVSVTANATSSSTAAAESNRFVYDVPDAVGANVNLTSLSGPGILLGSPAVPSGNVTGIVLQISGARAYWTDGSSTQLKVVADGKLMIGARFLVQSSGTTNLTLALSTGDVHVSPGNASVLRPVIAVASVSSGPSGTQTNETTETETNSTST